MKLIPSSNTIAFAGILTLAMMITLGIYWSSFAIGLAWLIGILLSIRRSKRRPPAQIFRSVAQYYNEEGQILHSIWSHKTVSHLAVEMMCKSEHPVAGWHRYACKSLEDAR